MSFYVYCLYSSGEVVYVGSTTRMRNRMSAHKADKTFDLIRYCETPSKKIMLQLEKYGIYKLQPKYNKHITKCTEKPDMDFHWKFMEVEEPTQAELNDRFIEEMNKYMQLQAEVLGVDTSWVYGVKIGCPFLFESFDIITNQQGKKVVVGYVDDSGKSLDDLCHSLGLMTFDQFREVLLVEKWNNKLVHKELK